MIANVGVVDRGLRLVTGLVLLGFGLQVFGNTGMSAAAERGALIAGALLAATAMLRFCPLYRVFGWSSCAD